MKSRRTTVRSRKDNRWGLAVRATRSRRDAKVLVKVNKGVSNRAAGAKSEIANEAVVHKGETTPGKVQVDGVFVGGASD